MLHSDNKMPDIKPIAAADAGPNKPAARNQGIAEKIGNKGEKGPEDNFRLGNINMKTGALNTSKNSDLLRQVVRG